MTILEPVIDFLKNRQRPFSLDLVLGKINRPRRPVLRVLDKLAEEGYLRETEDIPARPTKTGECGPPRRNPSWEIIQPVIERQHGNHRRQRRSKRDRIWKAIRIKRRFTRTEIQVTTNLPRGSVDDYTKLLHKAGYLRDIGKSGTEKVFLLTKDPGPQRPQISDKEVKA